MMRVPILISIFLLLGSKGNAGGRTRRFATPFGRWDPVEEQKKYDRRAIITRERILRNDPMPSANLLWAYCREWRFLELYKIMIMSPRMGYADDFYDFDRNIIRWSWSVWTEKVEAGEYAGNSLAVIVLDEREEKLPKKPPLAGVLVTDPEQKNAELATKYSVLIPGHYRWGEEVSVKTAVYFLSPRFPEFWCRVWAYGARTTVHQGQNYTVVQTLENPNPNETAKPAALLLPNQRTSHMIPSAKCAALGFPEGNTDLRRMDAKVVDCAEANVPDSNGRSAEGSYFCIELVQDLNHDFMEGVGWRWDAGMELDVPDQRRWPIYCQNWTVGQNSVEVDDEDGTFLLAGFMRYLKVIQGRALAMAQYFDFP